MIHTFLDPHVMGNVDLKWFKVHTRNTKRVPIQHTDLKETGVFNNIAVKVGSGDSAAWKSPSKDQTAGDKSQ